MKKQIKKCCMWFAAPYNFCIKFLWLNWRQKAFGKIQDGVPLKLKKMPSTPSPNEYLSFELIFTPVSFRWTIPLRCQNIYNRILVT